MSDSSTANDRNRTNRKAGRGEAVRRWLLPWLTITLVAALGAFGLSRTTLFQFDGWLYDLGILQSRATAPDNIVIVGITEKFAGGKHVKLMPRDKLARLIDIVAAGHPAVIAVDWWLDSYVDGDENPHGKDAQLRDALLRAKRSGVPVYLAQVELGKEMPNPLTESGITAHGSTLPYFMQAASGGGAVEFVPDYDGIFRTMPASTRTQPSLPFLTARTFREKQGGQPPIPTARLEREAGLSEGTPINFLGGPGAIQITPSDKILEVPALALLLSGKIVWIGATFPRSGDFFLTPYSHLMAQGSAAIPDGGNEDGGNEDGENEKTNDTAPSQADAPNRAGSKAASTPPQRELYGVELNAQATATLLQGAPRHSTAAPAAQTRRIVAIVLAAALVAALALCGVGFGAIGTLAVIGSACYIGFLSAREPQAIFGWHFWKASPPIFAALLAFGLGTAYRQMRLARELALVKEAFFGYVGDEVYRQLRGRPPELGGEMWNIAVLFCDIEGFSALAEGLRNDPTALLNMLNAHFQPLVEALKNRGAFVDNYVGDLVMALFGAPYSAGTLSGDTRNAVLAAIDFARIIEERNVARAAAGEPLIHVGIGLHCGSAVVGNLGAKQKMHYTAIGDTVNIASRVESTTRKYEKPLLVTEEVVEAWNASCGKPGHETEDSLVWNFIAETTVKGREAPVRLYALDDSKTTAAKSDIL